MQNNVNEDDDKFGPTFILEKINNIKLTLPKFFYRHDLLNPVLILVVYY